MAHSRGLREACGDVLDPLRLLWIVGLTSTLPPVTLIVDPSEDTDPARPEPSHDSPRPRSQEQRYLLPHLSPPPVVGGVAEFEAEAIVRLVITCKSRHGTLKDK